MKTFSQNWIASKKPNKQRKYRFNAPLHIRGSFMNVHLSKELREKHGVRAIRVRAGDKVKIVRGQFKKQDGKIESVDTKNLKLYIQKIEHTKRDGSKARYPIDPSNVVLIELAEDKRRLPGTATQNAKSPKPAKEPVRTAKPAAGKSSAAGKSTDAEKKKTKKEN